MREPALRIKICGLTTLEDAEKAAELGANAIGLNFYPQSPRFVEVTTAEAIISVLPATVTPVGLFVARPVAEIPSVLDFMPGLRVLQLHGYEPEVLGNVPRPVILAFQVEDQADLAQIEYQLCQWQALGMHPAALLVDAKALGLLGGTGKTAPWELLAEFRPGIPLVLAGGLNPENVSEAIRIVRPYAVDVASGVESAPGRKDGEKLKRFIDRAHEAAARFGLEREATKAESVL